MLLSREQIIGADDRKTKDVPVPEWGGTVRVRGLSGRERDSYEASIVQVSSSGSRRVSLENLRARLVSFACVDEEGNRLFSDDDVLALGDKSAAALERVFDEARKLSGLTEGDVEELAEGFGDAPNEPSTSA
jgi:hypothetical protein